MIPAMVITFREFITHELHKVAGFLNLGTMLRHGILLGEFLLNHTAMPLTSSRNIHFSDTCMHNYM